MQHSSTDRQKEKQTLINSLWESLFGVDMKKSPSKKVDRISSPNRRLYMIGLEDFSLDSSDKKFGNQVNKRKINDENANVKQVVKTLPDSGKKSLGHSERPKSKDAERKNKLRNEKINNKGDEKKLKQLLPKGFIPITDKDKEILNKEKMKNRAREVKTKDTNELLGRDMQKHSKVSFNLNHLPEDAKERSEIIAHVIQRVDSLKKRMQDEKQKLDEKCQEQKERSKAMRSSSLGENGESLSVKTIYWPKNEHNSHQLSPSIEDPVLCHFRAVTDVSNNYCDPKLKRLEKLSQTLNKKPVNIADVDKNPENHDIKESVGKLENIKLDQSKNVEECKIENEVCPNRKFENAKKPAQTDLKQKSTYKIKPHSASDTGMSICSSRVKNNQLEESGQPALAANKLINPKSQLDPANKLMLRGLPAIECYDDNKKESDKIKGDGEKQTAVENQTLEIPPKQVNVNEHDFGVFNIEIKNDDISTLFIMESTLDYGEVNMRRNETANHFLLRDGYGERGIMNSSCEVEKPRSDDYYEAKYNVSTELEQHSARIATSYSENTKSKLIQSFMESPESVMNTSPPSNIDTVNNYEVNTCHEYYYDDLMTGVNNMILQTNDFYKRDNRIELDNETKIPDNSVPAGDIYKLRSYIPASQRKAELKARYVPRLVSLSFYMQMASCYKIVAQFDKSLTCEAFSNQESSMVKKRAVQFVEYPECEYSLTGYSESSLSNSEEQLLEIQDLLSEDELESMVSDTLEQNQDILEVEDIEDKVENGCFGEVHLSNFEDNEIESPNTSLNTISNPVYVVIMDANEKHSSSFGKAEICKIESSRFSEIILNEISGVNKTLVVGSEPRKSAKTDKNSDVQRKNKSITIDKSGKQRLLPPQSRDKIKSRASSVCLPSGMKRNLNSPRAKFSQSNVVINRPKVNSQVAVNKQCSNVANEEATSKSKVAKNKRSSSLEPPEYLNSQLLSIREEIRELKNLFAKR